MLADEKRLSLAELLGTSEISRTDATSSREQHTWPFRRSLHSAEIHAGKARPRRIHAERSAFLAPQ
jgi:hypothetical protein